MKKYLFRISCITIILLSVLLLFCGCDTTYTPPPDTNHLYWKDIEVVITDVEHKTYGAAPAIRHSVIVSVYSSEYDLSGTYEFQNISLLDKQFGYEKGDIVTAQLYTWKNNVTGEINKREIHKVY